MITVYLYCLLHRGTGSLTNKTDIETAAAINVDSEAMSDNLQNVINHRHYVLNRLISGNVPHQIQECTCTLIQKQTNNRPYNTRTESKHPAINRSLYLGQKNIMEFQRKTAATVPCYGVARAV